MIFRGEETFSAPPSVCRHPHLGVYKQYFVQANEKLRAIMSSKNDIYLTLLLVQNRIKVHAWDRRWNH